VLNDNLLNPISNITHFTITLVRLFPCRTAPKVC
jgi:hypothetical protein